MIKFQPIETARACLVEGLRMDLLYLDNPHHPNHKGKKVMPARNCNCGGQALEDMLRATQRQALLYAKTRDGKRGKRSPLLYQGLIYSTPEGVETSPEERGKIEKLVAGIVGEDVPCRAVWHLDPDSGRDDLHVIFSAKTNGRLTIWRTYGNSKQNIHARMDAIDATIAKGLTQTRKEPVLSARAVRRRRAGREPLSKEIARLLGWIEVTLNAIMAAVRKLGHSVTKKTDRTVTIRYNGSERTGRYNLEKLVRDTRWFCERLADKVKTPHTPPDLPAASKPASPESPKAAPPPSQCVTPEATLAFDSTRPVKASQRSKPPRKPRQPKAPEMGGL